MVVERGSRAGADARATEIHTQACVNAPASAKGENASSCCCCCMIEQERRLGLVTGRQQSWRGVAFVLVVGRLHPDEQVCCEMMLFCLTVES